LTSGNWTTASLSKHCSDLVAASIDDLALFVGGGSYGIGDATVDIFNSTSRVWTNTLSQACQQLSTPSVGESVLFGGGTSQSSIFTTLDIFYPSIPAITPITEKITPTSAVPLFKLL